MIISSATIAGEEFAVLIVEHNWREQLKIKHGLQNSKTESIDGYDYARPTHGALRLGMSWQAFLMDDEIAELEDFFFSLGDTRVIVPIWCDKRKASDSSSRRYLGQVNIDWTESDYSDIVITTGGADPTYEDGYHCTAMIGRLKDPEFAESTPTVSQTRLTIIEDSPYWARIKPNSSASSWQWSHNWKQERKKAHRSTLVLGSLGNGREQMSDGSGNDRVVLSQNLFLQDSDIADFLGFYQYWRASGAPFYLVAEPNKDWVSADDGGFVEGMSVGLSMESTQETTAQVVDEQLENVDINLSMSSIRETTAQVVDEQLEGLTIGLTMTSTRTTE